MTQAAFNLIDVNREQIKEQNQEGSATFIELEDITRGRIILSLHFWQLGTILSVQST